VRDPHAMAGLFIAARVGAGLRRAHVELARRNPNQFHANGIGNGRGRLDVFRLAGLVICWNWLRRSRGLSAAGEPRNHEQEKCECGLVHRDNSDVTSATEFAKRLPTLRTASKNTKRSGVRQDPPRDRDFLWTVPTSTNYRRKRRPGVERASWISGGREAGEGGLETQTENQECSMSPSPPIDPPFSAARPARPNAPLSGRA